jgi:hypothetical protein
MCNTNGSLVKEFNLQSSTLVAEERGILMAIRRQNKKELDINI